jgi:hypothetical protein
VADGAPEPCGRCGAVPEVVVEIAEEVIGGGVDEEGERRVVP